MPFITDLSDPVFYPDKVKQVVASGEKGIFITKDPKKLFEIMSGVESDLWKKNILIEATVTGLGGTAWEPNVPDYKTSISGMEDFVRIGAKVVLRYDPIIPNINSSLAEISKILEAASEIGVRHVTTSVVDLYPHSAERIKNAGLEPPFLGFKYHPANTLIYAFSQVAQTLGIAMRVCCEQGWSCGDYGCDWPDLIFTENELAMFIPSNARPGCHCPKFRQLLTYADKCYHGCLYCYRKT